MEIEDFALFILTHKRADRVVTHKTLRDCGYSGDIYLIVDNEDDQYDRYKELYGDKVILFNKQEVAQTFDKGDNFNDLRSITCARNVSFEIAKKLGVKYFIELDDDYVSFNYKFDTEYKYKSRPIKNLDKVFKVMLEFYKNINALSIAMAQGGDFIGGGESIFSNAIKVKRKAMNSFICSTERPFKFKGILNEDVNTYTTLSSRGNLFFTINLLCLNQMMTQKNEGGITELYLDRGTYQKAFTTVMFSPSNVKISQMGIKNKRIHHNVIWRNCAPKIIREGHKK